MWTGNRIVNVMETLQAAAALRATGDLERALEAQQRAAPDDPLVHANLGMALHEAAGARGVEGAAGA